MRRLAIDTNVVLTRLGLQDKGSLDMAKSLFDSVTEKRLEIVTTEFLLVELINVLRWRFRMSKSTVDETLGIVGEIGMKMKPVEGKQIKQVGELMYKFDLTAYDSLFLETAMGAKCKLVTSDPKLLEVREWCVNLEAVEFEALVTDLRAENGDLGLVAI